MQPPQLWFTVPGLGASRPGRQWFRWRTVPAVAAADRSARGRRPLALPRRRLPVPGPRALVGPIACLLVLLPGLLTAEMIAHGYEARLTDDARRRALSGLDAATGLVDAERTRALNNADLAASRLGLLADQGTAPDALVKAVADLRTGMRITLVTLLDGGGRTLAGDPASNLPFGSTWEAKQALQGRSVVVLAERTPGFAVQAAAPLRVNGEVVPGAAIVAQNLDDGFLNTSSRLTGLDVALIQNGRLVAASRGIRRSFAYATDQTLDPELIAAGPDHFKRVRLGSETFFLAARTLTSGQREIGMLLVGSSADATADAVRRARALTYGAALVGALLAGLIGARIGRWQAQRVQAVAARVRAIAPTGARHQPPAPGANGLADAPIRGRWSDLDATVQATADAVSRRTEAQRRQAARLEAVLGSLADGVIVADEQRRVIFANPVARQLLHLPDGDGGPAPDGAGEGADHDGGIRAGDAAGDGTSAPIEPDASQRVIRSYAAPVLGDGGQPLGFVTVLRDATREQEVEQARAELLGVVSHELQTPLTAIKGALELVVDEDEGGLSRVQRRFLDTIDRNCARMIGLVGDLLDLSRMDAGRLELDSRPLDTPSVVAGSVAALANLFEQRHQTLRVDVPPETPPILGDRRRVEQILTNLLSNAAKYTPDGGEIDVTAGAIAHPGTGEGRVWIAVADSGPGIPEAEREQVFGRFYRGKATGHRGESGSGLGLAIVKSLVELHGGQVRATGPSNGSRARGARFVVDLPAAPDDSE